MKNILKTKMVYSVLYMEGLVSKTSPMPKVVTKVFTPPPTLSAHLKEMNRYKHIIYNPHMRNIESVINSLGGNPVWCFVRAQPVTEYEWVAIFETWDGNANEGKELGQIPLINGVEASLSLTTE